MLQYIWTKVTVSKEPSKNSFEFVHSARDPVTKIFQWRFVAFTWKEAATNLFEIFISFSGN